MSHPPPSWAPTDEDREVFAESMEWFRSLRPDDIGPDTASALDEVIDVLGQAQALHEADADPEAIAFLAHTVARMLVCAQVTHEHETGRVPESENAISYDEIHSRYIAPHHAAAQGVAKRVRRRSHHRPEMRIRARRRGAGRPRAQATRSSARSGDSPSDSEPHKPPVAPHRLAPSRAVLVGVGR